MAKSQKMGPIGSDDSGKYFPKKFRKIGKKSPSNCSGRKSGRIRPLQTDPPKWQNPKKIGLIGSDDSGKYFSKKLRKSVKLENQKIPRNFSGRKCGRNPPTADGRPEMAKSQKWSSSEVMIMGNTFQKNYVKA